MSFRFFSGPPCISASLMWSSHVTLCCCFYSKYSIVAPCLRIRWGGGGEEGCMGVGLWPPNPHQVRLCRPLLFLHVAVCLRSYKKHNHIMLEMQGRKHNMATLMTVLYSHYLFGARNISLFKRINDHFELSLLDNGMNRIPATSEEKLTRIQWTQCHPFPVRLKK